MKLKNNPFAKSCLLGVVLLLCSCTVNFTFTGASLPPEIESITILNFYNEALDGPANIELRFTEAMRDYFQRNTSLKQVNTGGGDLQFEGTVTGYEVAPVAAGASELQNAELNRLTISVKVSFTNNFEEAKSFEKSFSFFQNFPAEQNVQDVEQSLIPIIFEQIILDIFNASVADW